MSRSGVSCGPDCIPKYEELKLKKSHRYIIFKLSGDLKSIEVEKWSHDPDWESFVGELPETDCRYAVYDFQFEVDSSEGKRNKILFITWSPDTARVRSKMVYASSRASLRDSLNGIGGEIQATDLSEIDYTTVLEKVAKVKSGN